MDYSLPLCGLCLEAQVSGLLGFAVYFFLSSFLAKSFKSQNAAHNLASVIVRFFQAER